ncbi:hypothetical protein BD779DRAFT_1471400 [Infundibulicybe gibba]|nr:hypothetical protein BD779DRAFT_1471400 [Infundibulicybe gibba]
MEQLLDAVEEEWEIVPTTWWRTSYNSISWSYPRQDGGAPYIARPPYYHDILPQTTGSSSSSLGSSEQDQSCDYGEHSDIELNPDLVGVCAALIGVGFSAFDTARVERVDHQCNDATIRQVPPPLLLNKKPWDPVVDDSVGQSLSSSISELRTSVDFTESEGWIIPISVPSPTKMGVASTKNRTSSSSSLSSRPLNASASTFIPSAASTKPSKLPTTVESSASISAPPLSGLRRFGLPGLVSTNTIAPVIKVKKDEQGFYTGVETLSKSLAPPPRPSSALLPPFLQEPNRRKGSLSKTRSIVDRLRSSHHTHDTADASGDSQTIKGQTVSHSPSPSPTFHDFRFFQRRMSVSEDGWDCERVSSPSANDDEDGWIGVDASVKPGDNAIKAKRTRDLFLALTRRRSDPWEAAKTDGGGSTLDTELSSAPSSPSPSNDNNGWIEGPLTSPPPHAQANQVLEPPRSQSRPSSKRSHSANPSPASTQPPASQFPIHSNTPQSSYFPSSAPYFYTSCPPVPVPIPYATYIQMQTQLRLQLQLQAAGVAPVFLSGPPF